MKKFIGMMLLMAGGAVTVYGFNAGDSVASHASVLAGAPTAKTLLVLWIGAAVAVFGGHIALPPSNKI
jgi:hypothetical protein